MHELLDALDPAADELRAEQLSRWESGERVPLEELLAVHPGLSDNTEALLDLVYGEVLLREEHGDRPELEEYLRRFPQLTEALRRQFDVHEALVSLETSQTSGQRQKSSDETDLDSPLLTYRSPLTAPRQIGQYEVVQEVGRGGMGIVYKARHTLTGRLAAIKVIRPGDATEEERARFLTEAKAVSALSHPNIVRIHEVFAPAGEQTPFVALEYVSGGSLAAHINGTPLPPREAAALLQPLADAVAHAHAAGVVHRDLKPANVLLASPVASAPGVFTPGADATGLATPKITDFGLAKQLDADSGQTRTGAVMGTPSYMAPEQATGQTDRIGPAADIYALGAVLYEMLTGRPPFKGATILDTLDQVRNREPVAPRQLNPAVPRDLETICLKCLQKEPGRRFAACRELADDLTRYLNGEPIKARPVGALERAVKWVKRRPAAAVLLGVTGLAVAALAAVWLSFTIRLQEESQNARDQADHAREQARLAQQQTEEARKQNERAAHLLALTSAAVDDIAVNVRGAKLDEARYGNTGSVLFKLASFYARASSTLANDQVLPADDRQRLAEQYAVSAVRLLNCAQQANFFEQSRAKNIEALDHDRNLAVLRDRADYKRFRQRLR